MKKSFKKAGAAVLSMAMLLSMGAISMPVYAVDYNNEYKPAQLQVSIAGTKHADDDKNKYDYLSDISEATVDMYRVAWLDGEGWHWNSKIAEKLAANDPDAKRWANSATSGITDFNGTEEDFQKLLKRVVLNSTQDGWVDTNDNTLATAYPKLNSDDLQALASELERIVLADNQTNIKKIATGTLRKTGDTWDPAVLPSNADLYSEDPTKTTRDQKGYYLLITHTPDASVIIQPVLIPLQNTKVTDDNNDIPAFVQPVSLKGNNIDIEKTIENVQTNLNAGGDVANSDATIDKKYKEANAVSASKETAIVAGTDTVSYQIKAELPDYDKNLDSTKIMNFTITDTPDVGINVIGGEESGKYENVEATAEGVKNGKIKVYYSTDATFSTTNDVLLFEGVDYNVTSVTASSVNGGGFVITIDGMQLRGEKESTTNGITKLVPNPDSALHKDKTEATDIATMEKGYIFVKFDAQITDSLKRSYNDLTALTAAQQEAYTAAENAIVEPSVEDAMTNNKLSKDLVDTATAADDPISDALWSEFQAALYTEAYDATGDELTVLKKKAKTVYDAYVAEVEAANDGYENKMAEILEDANGNKNVAKMRYGTRYSTGQEPQESEDTVKVYSVDMKLDKVVVEHLIENNYDSVQEKPLYVTAVTAKKTSELGTDVALTEGGQTVYLKDVSGTSDASELQTTLVESEAKGYNATPENNDPYVVTAVTTSTTKPASANAGDTNYVYIAEGKTYVTTIAGEAATGGVATETVYGDLLSYEDNDDTKKAVENAVFELVHNYSATGAGDTLTDAGSYSLGYAVSTTPDGTLKMLKKVSKKADATKPDNAKWTDGVERDGVSTNKDILGDAEDPNAKYIDYYVLENDAEIAWKELTIGTYRLKEIYAPTGFKKWSDDTAVTFTIGATADNSDNNAALDGASYTGEFTGTTTSEVFVGGTDGGKSFVFENSTEVVDGNTIHIGQLINEIQNEYDDRLPATGGMGTVLFTAGGISIVLIAGALFVMYMKKKNSEEEE